MLVGMLSYKLFITESECVRESIRKLMLNVFKVMYVKV